MMCITKHVTISDLGMGGWSSSTALINDYGLHMEEIERAISLSRLILVAYNKYTTAYRFAFVC